MAKRKDLKQQQQQADVINNFVQNAKITGNQINNNTNSNITPKNTRKSEKTQENINSKNTRVSSDKMGVVGATIANLTKEFTQTNQKLIDAINKKLGESYKETSKDDSQISLKELENLKKNLIDLGEIFLELDEISKPTIDSLDKLTMKVDGMGKNVSSLTKNLEKSFDLMEKSFDKTVSIVERMQKSISESFDNIEGSSKSSFSKINKTMKDVSRSVDSSVTSMGNIRTGLRHFTTGIRNITTGTYKSITSFTNKMVNNINSGMKGFVKGAFNSIKSFTSGIIGNITGTITKPITNIFNNIKDTIKKPFNVFNDLINSMSNKIQNVKNFIKKPVKMAQNVYNNVKKPFTKVSNKVSNFADGILNKTDTKLLPKNKFSLNEQKVMKDTEIGIAISWLWKKYTGEKIFKKEDKKNSFWDKILGVAGFGMGLLAGLALGLAKIALGRVALLFKPLTTALKTVWSGIANSKWFQGFKTKIFTNFTSKLQSFTTWVGKLGGTIAQGWNKLKTIKGFGTVTKIAETIGKTAKTAGKTLASIGGKAGKLLAPLGKSITKGLGPLTKGLKLGLGVGGKIASKLAWPITAAMAVYDGFKGFKDENAAKVMGKDVKDLTMGDKFQSAASHIVSGFFMGLVDPGVVNKVIESGKKVFNMVFPIGFIIRNVKKLWNGELTFKGLLTDAWNTIKEGIKGWSTGFITLIAEIPYKAVQKIMKFFGVNMPEWDKVVENFKEILMKPINAIKDIYNKGKEFIGNAIENIKNGAFKVLDGMTFGLLSYFKNNSWDDITNNIKENFNQIKEKFVEFIKHPIKSLKNFFFGDKSVSESIRPNMPSPTNPLSRNGNLITSAPTNPLAFMKAPETTKNDKISEKMGELAEAGTKKGSIYTHDEGMHEYIEWYRSKYAPALTKKFDESTEAMKENGIFNFTDNRTIFQKISDTVEENSSRTGGGRGGRNRSESTPPTSRGTGQQTGTYDVPTPSTHFNYDNAVSEVTDDMMSGLQKSIDKNLRKSYKLGAKMENSGNQLDCSGFVSDAVTSMMKAINEDTKTPIFSSKAMGLMKSASWQMVQNVYDKTGEITKLSDMKPGQLKAGQIIGTNASKNDKGRFKGIDHVFVVGADGMVYDMNNYHKTGHKWTQEEVIRKYGSRSVVVDPIKMGDWSKAPSPKVMTAKENQDKIIDSQLGSLSRKYESNGRADRISSGIGDKGGISFGAYQYSSKTGGLFEYMKYLKKTNPEYFNALTANGAQYFATKNANKQFQENWKALANKDPEGFLKSQHEGIKALYYNPSVKTYKKLTGKDPSNAVANALWSTAVQHGVPGSRNIFNKTLRSGMSDEEVLNAIYKQRSIVRPSEANTRYVKELKDAHAMLLADKEVMKTPDLRATQSQVDQSIKEEDNKRIAQNTNSTINAFNSGFNKLDGTLQESNKNISPDNESNWNGFGSSTNYNPDINLELIPDWMLQFYGLTTQVNNAYKAIG